VDVVVHSNELVPGLLPAVCVKTGEPAELTRKANFRYTPLWVWLLLPFGVLIALIVAEACSTRVRVDFPVSRQVVRDHRRRIWVAVGTMIAAPIALLFAAGALHQPAIAWLALVAFVVGLVLAFRAQTWISGKLSKAGTIALKGVAPVWAEQRQALVAYHANMAYQAYQQQAAYAQYQQDVGLAQQRAYLEGQAQYHQPSW